jgi:hypothetical protein
MTGRRRRHRDQGRLGGPHTAIVGTNAVHWLCSSARLRSCPTEDGPIPDQPAPPSGSPRDAERRALEAELFGDDPGDPARPGIAERSSGGDSGAIEVPDVQPVDAPPAGTPRRDLAIADLDAELFGPGPARAAVQVAPPPQPSVAATPEFPPPIVFDPPSVGDAPSAPEADPWFVPLATAAAASASAPASVDSATTRRDRREDKHAKGAKKAKKESKAHTRTKGREAEPVDQPVPPSFPPPSAAPVIDLEPEPDSEPWPAPSGPPSPAAEWVQLALAGDGGYGDEPPLWTTDREHRRRRVGAILIAACGVALGLGTTLFLLRDDGGGEAKRLQLRSATETVATTVPSVPATTATTAPATTTTVPETPTTAPRTATTARRTTGAAAVPPPAPDPEPTPDPGPPATEPPPPTTDPPTTTTTSDPPTTTTT